MLNSEFQPPVSGALNEHERKTTQLWPLRQPNGAAGVKAFLKGSWLRPNTLM